MKKTVSVFLSILIFLSIIFGFIGCAESVSNDDNTSGVTLNFNGTTLHGKNAKYLNSEDIAPYVGMPIQEALAEMDLGIGLLERNGFSFVGWTKTKDGEDYVSRFPTFGTIYAKWQSTGNQGGGSSGGGVTIDPSKLFANGDVIGDFSVIQATLEDGSPTYIYDDTKTLRLVYEGDGVYSATFTYFDYMCGWGGGNGICEFKIRTVTGSWEDSYGIDSASGEQPIVDGAEVLCDSILGNNIRTYLIDGITYKITVRCTSNGNVYVKIATVK